MEIGCLMVPFRFHSLVPDGVWILDDKTGRPRFRRLPNPSNAEVGQLVQEVAEAVEGVFARLGYGGDDDVDLSAEADDDGLATLQAAALGGWSATRQRATRRIRTHQVIRGQKRQLPPRCAVVDGYNLHAGVLVKARNRGGLERLARYIARAPLAKSRLSQRADGKLVPEMKRAWSDGTSAIVFSPLELLLHNG